MTKEVDSYRFVSRLTGRVIKAWVGREPPVEIPWQPLTKPAEQWSVAMISSAGVALKDDKPFDQEGERQNPWWGDPSFRVIPPTATATDVHIYHLHIDPQYALADLNCIFPLERLLALADNGEIGRSAAHHYSIMGYILNPQRLLAETTPAIIERLKKDDVDVVLMVPV